MIKKYKIVSTPTCIKCKRLKSYFDELGLEKIEEIDASTPEGLAKAKELKLNSVPMAILYDEKGESVGIAHDEDEVDELMGN